MSEFHSGLRVLRSAFVAGALSMAVCVLSGKAKHETSPEAVLQVRLYDRAQVPAETLQLAMGESSRIFKMAGIKLDWNQPSVEPSEDRGLDMSAADARRTGGDREYLVIRILRTTSANVFPGALGFALPFAQSGAHVEIFYDRVLATARSRNAIPYLVLGCAMAHESGHVLLRSSDHSSGGLMQTNWNELTWHLASKGLLAFLPGEKSQMRQRVLAFQGSPKLNILVYRSSG